MFEHLTWRTAALCLLFVAGARAAGAQHVATSFEQLAVLVNRGDHVTVADDAGREIHGKIADLSPSALTLVVDGICARLTSVMSERSGNGVMDRWRRARNGDSAVG